MNTLSSPLLGLSQRLPPSNLQAEQALLGALLANNKAYERVSEFLLPEHFADPIHGRIFQAIHRRVEAGQLADAVTLKAEFEHSGVLEEVGGTAYLAQLLTAMVGIINAGEYARAIHDAWLRRQLIDLGETVVNNAFGAEPELDGRAQIEVAEQSLFDLSNRGGEQGGFMTFERAARSGRQDGRAASVRPGDPGRAARHGKDRAGDQDRLRRGARDAGGRAAYLARRAARRKTPGCGCDLFVGDERRAARHPSAGRAGGGVGRPDPPRRDRPEGFRSLLPGQPRPAIAADPHRRHAGDHAVGDAHALPAPQAAGEGPGAGGGGLPAADAPLARHQAGEPRAGDQPDHAGAEGAGQGAGGAGPGAVAAVARGRGPRGQASAAVGPARERHDRAGRRRGDVRLSRRILHRPARAEDHCLRQRGEVPVGARQVAVRHGSGAQHRRADHRQAAPRPDRPDQAVLRSRVHWLRRSGCEAFWGVTSGAAGYPPVRFYVAVVSSRATATSKPYKGVSRRLTARDCAASDAPPSSRGISGILLREVGGELVAWGLQT